MYKVSGNVMYITAENAYLNVKQEALQFCVDGIVKRTVPPHDVSQIIVLRPSTTLSVYAMKFCAENQISVHYISEYGYYQGCFKGAFYGSNVLLRRAQYLMVNTTKATEYVRCELYGKFKNSIWYLKDMSYHSLYKDEIHDILVQLRSFFIQLSEATSIAEMRGIEGIFSTTYFSAFDYLIKSQKDDFSFDKRTRRPPENKFNALLSFFYTLLTTMMDSALLCVGLDDECGFLHLFRAGRYSLACDLVEEFRFLVDKFVIKCVNLNKVKPSDFVENNGEIKLTKDGSKKMRQAWSDYLDEEKVVHGFHEKKMSLRVLFYEQARYLAKYVRGDIPEYPVYVMKG